MHIKSFRAENYKRLSVVEIAPDGKLVQITGKNGHGKSSVLQGIFEALAGADAAIEEPIRQGEQTARLRLDLGEIIVTKRFRADAPPILTLETVEGARFPSPQKMLDSIHGRLGFDPMEFIKMKPAEQYELLRRTVKLEVDVDALDKANATDFETRTVVNREVKSLAARVASLPALENLPEKPINTAELVAKIADAGSHNAGIQRHHDRVEELNRLLDGVKREAQDLDERAADLERQAAALRLRSKERSTEADRLAEEISNLPAPPEPIDVAELQQELSDANRINDGIRVRTDRRMLEQELAAKEAEAEALTKAMEDRKEQKAKAIAGAKMPVEGLTFDDGKLRLNGVLFANASTAQQIRAACAIAAGENPKLRVILIREGSFLDEDGLAAVAAWAEENDYQVWLERVDSSGKIGIVMEDGHVKGQEGLEPTPEETPRRKKAAAAKEGTEGQAAEAADAPKPPPAETTIAPKFDL